MPGLFPCSSSNLVSSVCSFQLSSLSVKKESSLEGKHLVVSCSLNFSDSPIQTHVLIDCGATRIAFVDEEFVRHHQLPVKELKTPRALEVIYG